MSELSNKNSAFTLENFIAAVEGLLHSNNNEIMKQANEYLLHFEKSNEAWDVSIEVMNTTGLSDAVYYNASQIIAKKLRFDFGNYTESKDIQEKLAVFFIEKIIQFKDHQVYLLTNLCKCFGLFIIFAHKQLPDVIKQLVGALDKQNMRSIIALLSIFNHAAENVLNDEIVVDQNYKNSFELFLLTLAEEVIMFLNNTVIYIASHKGEISNDPSMSKLINKSVN
jgi:hypothetical protein